MFDSFRMPKLEEPADFTVRLEVDELDKFDYEETIDLLKPNDCLQYLQKEIQLFKIGKE